MAPNDRCGQDWRSWLRAGRGGSRAATLPAEEARDALLASGGGAADAQSGWAAPALFQ